MYKFRNRVFLEKSTFLGEGGELLSISRLLMIDLKNVLFNADANGKAVFPKLKNLKKKVKISRKT